MVFRHKTTFVLGAGASVDFGFPSGPDLLAQIRELLEYRFDQYSSQPTHGDGQILEAIKQHFNESGRFDKTNRIVQAGRKLIEASEYAISIDNVIDALEDSDVAFAGKLAIARAILLSEGKLLKNLQDRQNLNKLNFSSISNTWIVYFLQLLTADIKGSQIGDLFENIAIINFNYDRVLEFLLPPLIATHYSVSKDVAQNAFNKLRIYRPYGRLGKLAWQIGDERFADFGAANASGLVDAGSGLKTFTEQIDDIDLLSAIEEILNSSSRVVFMGFGYHRQNIRLLARRKDIGGQVVGTTFDMLDPQVDAVRGDIRSAMLSDDEANKQISLVNLDCAGLLKSYGRLITS